MIFGEDVRAVRHVDGCKRQMTLRAWLSEFQRIIVSYNLHSLYSSRRNTRHQGTMTYYLHHGCTNAEGLIAQVTKFCTVDPRISARLLQLFSYVKRVSVHIHRAVSARWQCDYKVTPELCVLSMDPAAYHPYGFSNLEVARRLYENLCTPGLSDTATSPVNGKC